MKLAQQATQTRRFCPSGPFDYEIHVVKHAVIHHIARKQNKNIEEIISIEVLSRCIDWVFSRNGLGMIEISVHARVIYL